MHYSSNREHSRLNMGKNILLLRSENVQSLPCCGIYCSNTRIIIHHSRWFSRATILTLPLPSIWTPTPATFKTFSLVWISIMTPLLMSFNSCFTLRIPLIHSCRLRSVRRLLLSPRALRHLRRLLLPPCALRNIRRRLLSPITLIMYKLVISELRCRKERTYRGFKRELEEQQIEDWDEKREKEENMV